MVYEESRRFADISLKNWFDQEMFSFGWFLEVFILAVFYIVWLKLLERKRAVLLLLIGSLAAVAYAYVMMFLYGILGFYEYVIRLVPSEPPFLVSSVTLAPIIIMLVEQYSSSWKKYFLLSAIGLALLNFVIFPIYTWAGVLKLHHGWNWGFHFLVMYSVSMFIRVVFLWITGIQHRNSETKAHP